MSVSEMMPGLFDLPAPLLEGADKGLGMLLPAPAVLALWAAVGAVLSLELYRFVSPQQYISRIRHQVDQARRQLARHEGDMDEAWPLLKSMLGLSFKRVAVVMPATLLGAYPILALLVWLSSAYGYRYPVDGETVNVKVAPPMQARWQGERQPPGIQVLDRGGQVILEAPLTEPEPVLHKWAWWNLLAGNPAGYLPSNGPVEEIIVGLPKREFITAGPTWLHGWEAVFLPVMLLVALVYKSLRRIE